jgi:hypothetical protein
MAFSFLYRARRRTQPPGSPRLEALRLADSVITKSSESDPDGSLSSFLRQNGRLQIGRRSMQVEPGNGI